MNTNKHESDRMPRDILFRSPYEKDAAYPLIGAAMAVHNALGTGFREKTYERALCVEFEVLGIPYTSQRVFPVFYRNRQIDEYVPDLIAGEGIIIETKVVEAINDVHVGQVLNYLNVTGLKLGLLLNFKNPKLEIRRVIA